MTEPVHPVDEILPAPRLFTLGMQHVLVMYAGAIAVPLIVGRALNLAPHEVAFLISADLFVCGIASIIQSLGATQYFGIRLPVMMGVTFAAVGPMVAIAGQTGGTDGARALFGAVIAAGVIAILLAPMVSRMLRFFPPVVTGTVILAIGISLMPIGINWIFGLQAGPTAPMLVDPAQQAMLDQAIAAGAMPQGARLAATVPNPAYATPGNLLIAALVLGTILIVSRFAKGFWANIAVLIGIVVGGGVAAMLGMMDFAKVGQAAWFGPIIPFHFGMPTFDPVMILTMVLVMIVVMIESTGMFLALSEMCDRPIGRRELAAGLRVDGLGTLLGGIFNTFPYTSFSQNVGLVGVTGIRSRFVCVAGGAIMIVLGLIPKMGALVESLPTTVLGGAGLVMFGMVAATGVRILGRVDFAGNRHNLFIVAISVGMAMIPLVAPNFKQWLPHVIHPLIHSGILLAAISAVLLNWFYNGAQAEDEAEIRVAGGMADH
ncbi:MAG: nucleobase:cation symporter-2 family protein [Paracoccus sp. (in: a-proteobacteria)]|uniref:nucleobase:cation symporter-2 family protein n=1 Tax=Paracoccus sp. TaxID=267 RepID=UPI0026DF69F3|nr:nucleobase:cation symporter-2 family protein [Paracoccus sp. (in: a-proteobacteria)]MDO5631712.1 nucleobase:cation symporter-2 family protein [Paracoccus sp. (in: a-proteobacteria)]